MKIWISVSPRSRSGYIKKMSKTLTWSPPCIWSIGGFCSSIEKYSLPIIGIPPILDTNPILTPLASFTWIYPWHFLFGTYKCYTYMESTWPVLFSSVIKGNCSIIKKWDISTVMGNIDFHQIWMAMNLFQKTAVTSSIHIILGFPMAHFKTKYNSEDPYK